MHSLMLVDLREPLFSYFIQTNIWQSVCGQYTGILIDNNLPAHTVTKKLNPALSKSFLLPYPRTIKS